MTSRNTPANLVRTTVTSFKILDLLGAEESATIDDVADRLGIARSTAHRHLQTLAEYRFAAVDDNEYSLGPRFLELGLLASPERTIEQAFDILDVLKQLGGGSAVEVAKATGLPKSVVEQQLHLLERSEFIVSEDGRYRIGLKFLDFGIYARGALDYYEIAREQVDMLAEETGEKVRLIGIENGLSVLLYRVMGNHRLQTTARIGNRRPLHQLAAGKSILAFLPREEVDAIIDRWGLLARTENTITDTETLFAELKTIREQGYGFNREESIEGLNAVGAPFRDDQGRVIGALSISGPANRLKGDLFKRELPNLLMAATNEVEINLKYATR